MEVVHDDDDLEVAETNPNYRGGIDRVVVRGMRKALNLVRCVPNEMELAKHRGLNFEKLKGKRAHQHSLRINSQWRLIVEIQKRPGSNANVCVVKSIEDYH